MIAHNDIFAVVFPGQASQHIGMLSDLANSYHAIRDTFYEASEILNYDVWNLVQFGPISELNKTYYSQPAILTASVAIWKVWMQQIGKLPNVMAGHSLGEYSALVCSGSIDFLSAIKLVTTRSVLMQEISPDGYGAMSIIIGLSDDVVRELCQIVESIDDQIVAPAGFNTSDNIVISGHKAAVNHVNLLCKKAGAKYVTTLPISVPSHCSIMKKMVSRFQKIIENTVISSPKIPVINNVDVSIEQEPQFIRDSLIRQLYNPVRWNEIMQEFINKDIKIVLEMGPGKVLTRLIQRSVYSDSLFSLSINDVDSLSKAIQCIIRN
ncbi:malonyl CoA-acyl carrier protein transacylase [Candidatus Blochmanniella floridana]|uniref:Malonyl CoA-acyl carrier protein transacylase n=1 Tax=Blochmanniella floridana TaxID=203907 RepID=Q7VR19_BLOFL|nr:malonyl CoA-acyl carrier protein transacylase [Candidatus Blochmannia floridanus]